MTITPLPLHLAIAQLPMAWTVEENVRAVCAHLALARQAGAQGVIFPEMAVTGYHRRVPEGLTQRVAAAALDEVRAACAHHRIPALVGSPVFAAPDGGRPRNAAVAIGSGGEVVAVCAKIGLTASERTYFAAGDTRATFTFADVRAGVMLCREVRDLDDLERDLAGARMILWPGAIRWREEVTVPDNHVTEEHAGRCARRLNAWVVQCNWAQTLNDPGAAGMGGSVVVTPAGEVLTRGAFDRPGLTLVTIPNPAVAAGVQAGDAGTPSDPEPLT